MFINIKPLTKYRDFRLLYIGQFLSFIGSMVTYVAIPYEVYDLTKDNKIVGLVSIAQLIPVILFGIIGGAYADRLNRRKLLLVSEVLMCLLISIFAWNAFRDVPSVPLIFVTVFLLQSVVGFHRPAMDALNQKMVEPEDYAAIGALGSFRWSVGAIIGPALGGLIIAKFGVKGAYLFDVVTFMGALICIFLMKRTPNPEKREHSPLQDIKEGLRFAVSKPELIGTYLIDIVAMLFAFPVALFPAMAEGFGGAKAAGILFSGMATGAMIMTLLSGWSGKVKFHGRAVVIAAMLWAVFIFFLGFAHSLPVAFICLVMAGAADMLSGLFRGIIWNQTVPNELRGRLSGIEMISYMSGPLLGNARAGYIASVSSVSTSIMSGGVICFIAVFLTALCLPKFWGYVDKAKATS
jgi:MFS family permease